MGLVARKPVFRISDKVGFKPACSPTYTSLKVEISLEASLDMICDFQQCGILTSIDSDEPVPLPFKLRNSK